MNTRKLLGFVCIAAGLLLTIGLAQKSYAQEADPQLPAGITVTITGQTRLSWEAPTENVDGTDLDDLAGYRIFWGRMSGNYAGQLDVVDGAAANWGFAIPITDELDIDWFFVISALDEDGHESGYSNEVQGLITVVFVNSTPPKNPTRLRVSMDLQCTTDNQFYQCDATFTTITTND